MPSIQEPVMRDGLTATQTKTSSTDCRAAERAPRRQKRAEASHALGERGLTSSARLENCFRCRPEEEGKWRQEEEKEGAGQEERERERAGEKTGDLSRKKRANGDRKKKRRKTWDPRKGRECTGEKTGDPREVREGQERYVEPEREEGTRWKEEVGPE
ncbi:hypothetical protein NDU88_010515 [Pleurodeles waltl]|uniref:Uncharacterized protein n=1 Tax=Pleurodeles waltl TaxID=8319 RepID=A0AAV7R0F5_PLEWA|nr:hypothetical protein NDU88_010515 [Pleurodeles waltl]